MLEYKQLKKISKKECERLIKNFSMVRAISFVINKTSPEMQPLLNIIENVILDALVTAGVEEEEILLKMTNKNKEKLLDEFNEFFKNQTKQ